MIPERTMTSIRKFADEHRSPGGWLIAVLSNDLVSSFAYADKENKPHLQEIIDYIYWEIPGSCWGSPDKVSEWLKAA